MKLFVFMATFLFVIVRPIFAEVAATSLKYEPEVVELTGIISFESHYGPPNFGENPKTDKKVLVPILTLQHPVSVQGDPRNDLNGDTFNNVDHIQIIVTSAQSLKKYDGKNVVVKGSLFEKQSGEHFADVLITLRSISIIP